jgi:RNA-directed DNA polymerase
MGTLYIEGVASHGGPESCVGVPRGRSEALAGGVWAGLLSRETTMKIGVLTLSFQAEGDTAGGVFASCWRASRGRRAWARTTSSMRENREISWLPVVSTDASSGMVRGVVDRRWAGREGNAEAVIP